MANRPITNGSWLLCLIGLQVVSAGFSGCGAGFRLGASDIRFVQSQNHAAINVTNGVGTTTPVFSAPPQVGNTMVVVVWGYHSTATGISNLSDNASNVWLNAVTSNLGASTIPVAIWYAPILATSPNYTINVVPSASSTLNLNRAAAEFSGLVFAAPLDATSQFLNNTPTMFASVGPTLPPSRSQSLVVAGAVFNAVQGSIIETGGMSALFTDLGSGATGQGLYQITQATTGRSAQWTVSAVAQNATVIAVFKGQQ